MRPVLFIDRDGTLIIEPPVTFQIDSLELLEFYPKVFRNLYKIATKKRFSFGNGNQSGRFGYGRLSRRSF